MTAAVTITSLPDELILYMMMFMADTDLQTITRVSPHLRRLASDIVLWKNFRLVKNSAILKSRLFGDTRPDRVHLVNNNVLRGVHPHQIRSGQYINSPTMKLLHESQIRISWLMREQHIKSRLTHRPDQSDLETMGVIPAGVRRSSDLSPILMARAINLRKALKQAILHRKLQARQSIDECSPNVFHGVKSRNVAPSLVATKIELERQFNGRDLQRKITLRPAIEEIDGLIPDARHNALRVCPSVRPKIKNFENMTELQQ